MEELRNHSTSLNASRSRADNRLMRKGSLRYAAALTLASIASPAFCTEIVAHFDSALKYSDFNKVAIEVKGDKPDGIITVYRSDGMFQEFSDGWERSAIVKDLPRCIAPVVNGKATCVLGPLGYPAVFPVPTSVVYDTVKNVPYYQLLQFNYSGDSRNAAAELVSKQLLDYEAVHLAVSVVSAKPVAGQEMTLSAIVRMHNVQGEVTFYKHGGAPLPGCANMKLARPAENNYYILQVGNASAVGIANCTIKAGDAGTASFDIGYTNGVDKRTALATLDVQVGANAPIDRSGMYWHPSESGWGMSVVQHGDKQVNIVFGYDNAMAARWYIMPEGKWDATLSKYSGALYQPTSSPYFAYDSAVFKANEPIGDATIQYSQDAAILNFKVNGESGSKSLTKQVFGASTANPHFSVGDLWWGGADDVKENGWGVTIAQQGETLVPIWFTYDASGKSTWFPFFPDPKRYRIETTSLLANLFTSTIYEIRGAKAPTAAFDPASVSMKPLDNVTFTGTSTDPAELLSNFPGTASGGFSFQNQEAAIFVHPIPCTLNDFRKLSALCYQQKIVRRQQF